MPITAHLLGPPLMVRDGIVYGPPKGKKVWALLAYLALSDRPPTRQQLLELLAAIEEKHKLVALLTGFIESPEPVHVEIGIKEMPSAGEHLALISAPYSGRDQLQGTVGVLGPMRMQYERAITAVAYVARVFSDTLNRS